MIFRQFIFALICLFLADISLAENIIKVQAMNYPAWLVRNHQTLALIPGYRLRTDDLIRTGKRGRVVLQLADGGTIKLTESTRFLIKSSATESTLEESELQLLRGAFRFTSSSIGNGNAEHHANIGIGSISVQISNTDIWGQSNSAQIQIALVEGVATVNAPTEPPLTLEQAGSLYIKPREEASLPIEQLDLDELQRLINRTELDETQGIATEDGEWAVVLVSLTNRKNTDKALKALHSKGYPVQRKSVIRQGKTLHRLLLADFASIEDAVKARAEVADSLGIKDAWVWRYVD